MVRIKSSFLIIFNYSYAALAVHEPKFSLIFYRRTPLRKSTDSVDFHLAVLFQASYLMLLSPLNPEYNHEDPAIGGSQPVPTISFCTG